MNATARLLNLGISILFGISVFVLLIPSATVRAQGCGCALCDFDADGDVDQEDFGHLQECLSGSGVVQTDPDCIDANVDEDEDGDVDQNDFSVFQACISGAGIPFDVSGLSDVLVTEFMASNGGTLADEDGDYPDWIEIHNPCRPIVDLEGWHLTDDAGDLDKWQFPSVTLVRGEYLVVFASDKDRAVAGSPLHTNFKLTSDGEYLALVRPDGVSVAHEYAPAYPEQHTDISYGVYDGQERYFAMPTPWEANDGTFIDFVADTQFSHDRGFYETPFQVEITTETAGATIRYTLNCTAPTQSTGSVYSGPITISTTTCLRAAAFKPGWQPTNVDTQTYVFLDHVLTQTRPSGYPTSWSDICSLAAYHGEGCPPYDDACPYGCPGDYEMDPEIYNDPDYAGLMETALTSIPTMSLVTDKNNLFHASSGIYMNPTMEGVAWERPASAEFFDVAGSEEFQIDCGLRIHGGVGREPHYNPKHSFRLLFKDDYGSTKLRFPLFGTGATDEFDTIVLRAGFNNKWTQRMVEQRLRAQYTRDQWARDTQLAMGRVSGHGRFVHLYLNGLYWGLYNVIERPSAPFLAAYFGGEKEDYDALNAGQAVDGDTVAWNTAQAIANAGVGDPAGYDALSQYVDIPNLIDYMILNFYAGNTDWDGGANWYAGRRRAPGEGFRFFSWDAEWLFQDLYGDDVTGVNNSGSPSRLYAALCENPEFRMLFADHVHRHFFHGGVLTPQAVADQWMVRANEIDLAVIGESARWGDYRRDVHRWKYGPYELYTRNDHWLDQQSWLLNTCFPARTDVVLGFLRNADPYPLYPDVDAPEFNQHGGEVPSGFNLTMSVPAGMIYYTLDGSDPRLPGGAINPGAISYHAHEVMVPQGSIWRYLDDGSNQGTAWRDRLFDDSGWAEGPAQLGYGDGDEATVVSYGSNPYNKHITTYFRHSFSVADASSYVGLSVALLRDDAAVVYLNGQEIARSNLPEGTIDYSTITQHCVEGSEESTFFPYGVDPALLVEGADNVLAVEIHLCHATTEDLSFDLELSGITTGPPIPLTESVQVKARALDGAQWTALNEATFDVGPTLFINEFMADNVTVREDPDEPGEYPDWIELYNADATAVDLGGMYLTDDLTNPTKWQIPPGVSIDPGGYRIFWADEDEEQGDTHTNFKLDKEGEEIGLFDLDGATQIDSIVFGQQYGDVSYGRYPDGIDDWGFFATPTPDAANGPHDGP